MKNFKIVTIVFVLLLSNLLYAQIPATKKVKIPKYLKNTIITYATTTDITKDFPTDKGYIYGISSDINFEIGVLLAIDSCAAYINYKILEVVKKYSSDTIANINNRIVSNINIGAVKIVSVEESYTKGNVYTKEKNMRFKLLNNANTLEYYYNLTYNSNSDTLLLQRELSAINKDVLLSQVIVNKKVKTTQTDKSKTTLQKYLSSLVCLMNIQDQTQLIFNKQTNEIYCILDGKNYINDLIKSNEYTYSREEFKRKFEEEMKKLEDIE